MLLQALRAKPEAVTRACQVGSLQDGQAPTVEVFTAAVDGGRMEQLEEELERAHVTVQVWCCVHEADPGSLRALSVSNCACCCTVQGFGRQKVTVQLRLFV